MRRKVSSMRLNQLRVLSTTLGLVFVCSASAVELIVSNYFGDSVGKYSLATGAFLGNLTGGSIDGPLQTRVGADGLLYVTSELNNSVQRFSLSTNAFVDTFASGTGLNAPTAITFDGSGNALVANFNDSTIAKFNPSGVFQGHLVPSGSGGLSGPDTGTVVGPDGSLYVPSFNNNSIFRYNATTGAFLGVFANSASGLTQPRTILFRDGKVWVTSDNGNKVLRYNTDGTLFDTFVTAGSGSLFGATGMVFGEDGFLYVASSRNNRILKYSMADGSFAGIFASGGSLNGPVALTVVPEPATMVAFGMGIVAFFRRWRK